MTKKNRRKSQAKILRACRKIHRTAGASLFVFFFIISITGLLLGWKSHSNGMILPKSHIGTSTNLKDWLPLDSLHTIACNVLRDSVSTELSSKIGRIDVRKNKGMVKFVFKNHAWGIQLDGATGQVLHIGRRNSDILENIHDGSILDDFFGTKRGEIKLIYTSIMGIALLTFTITGFWLWYGPKQMRKQSRKN